MDSMTSPFKEAAGIACPTALLLEMHHRACALLELISDSLSLGTIVTLFPAVLEQQ